MLKIKIKKYMAEGQSSIISQIKSLFDLIDTAKTDSPVPLLARLTGNKEIGKFFTDGKLNSDARSNPEVMKVLEPFLSNPSSTVTEDINPDPVTFQTNTGEMNQSGSHDQGGNESPSTTLNSGEVYKAAFTEINKLAQAAVDHRAVDFANLSAINIISTANEEFINRALKYAPDSVKHELTKYISEPESASTLGLDWFPDFSSSVVKALEKVEEVRSQSKTNELNALATMIVSQYNGKDFTNLLIDYVKSHPNQSPCDGYATMDGQKEPITILGLAAKAYAEGITRPFEYLAKTFPEETLEDNGEGSWQAPILSVPTEKQDEVQEAFYKFKQEKGNVSPNPEDAKVSSSEMDSDRFGGDVNKFLQDLLTPYMMISFDGKIINDSNDEVKALQAPLGDSAKEKGTLKLSTIQAFAKHSIENGLVELDVDEEALDISKMKRGMKEVAKRIIDSLGKQSKRNSNGLTSLEQQFLRGVAKNCVLLPNGAIASLAKLRELRDLGKKKSTLHKWLSNPENRRFKQSGFRDLLGKIAHPIDTISNAAKDVGEKLGFGESFQELQHRVIQRVMEARVKDQFGMQGLLRPDPKDYLILEN